jgi:hypothetical protein
MEKDIVIPEIIETKSGKKLPSIQYIEKEYSKKIENLKKNRSWLRYLIAGGVIFTSLFLASLVLMHIVKGAVALGIGALTLLIFYYGYKAIKTYDPLIQKKMQNDALRRLIKEAQEKKIETLTAYVEYLDDYLNQAKMLRNKVDMLLEKFERKKANTNDEFLIREYDNLIKKLQDSKKAIEKIVEASRDKKKKFENILKVAREKYDFIEETEDIVKFLSNSDKALDKILVDESLNQLEKEFLQISTDIKNLADDIQKEDSY